MPEYFKGKKQKQKQKWCIKQIFMENLQINVKIEQPKKWKHILPLFFLFIQRFIYENGKNLASIQMQRKKKTIYLLILDYFLFSLENILFMSVAYWSLNYDYFNCEETERYNEKNINKGKGIAETFFYIFVT